MFYIYKLYLGGILVYIGSTKDVKSRLIQHASEKEFDSAYVCGVAGKDLCVNTEQYLIEKYDPAYNRMCSFKEDKPFLYESQLAWESYKFSTVDSINKFVLPAVDIVIPSFLVRRRAVRDKMARKQMKLNLEDKFVYALLYEYNGCKMSIDRFCINTALTRQSLNSIFDKFKAFGILTIEEVDLYGSKPYIMQRYWIKDISNHRAYLLL